MSTNCTMNVCHRLGLLGKLAINAAAVLSRFGVRFPVPLLVWAVEHSSFVSIDGGRWQRCRPGLCAEDFA